MTNEQDMRATVRRAKLVRTGSTNVVMVQFDGRMENQAAWERVTSSECECARGIEDGWSTSVKKPDRRNAVC